MKNQYTYSPSPIRKDKKKKRVHNARTHTPIHRRARALDSRSYTYTEAHLYIYTRREKLTAPRRVAYSARIIRKNNRRKIPNLPIYIYITSTPTHRFQSRPFPHARASFGKIAPIPPSPLRTCAYSAHVCALSRSRRRVDKMAVIRGVGENGRPDEP